MPGARMTPTLVGQLGRDLRAKVRRKLGRQDTPWMKAKELDILVEVLDRLAPARCLEWGAGLSTLWFPPRLPRLTRWLSIEHQAEWYARMRDRNRDPRVELVHIPPDHGDYVTTRREGTLEDFRTYVTHPDTLGEQFDFILVDGRARQACLQVAWRVLAEEGVVVLHDANRAAYFEHLPPFAHQERFTDWKRRGGGIWVGTKRRPVADLLDVAAHRRLWRAHDRVSRVLSLK